MFLYAVFASMKGTVDWARHWHLRNRSWCKNDVSTGGKKPSVACCCFWTYEHFQQIFSTDAFRLGVAIHRKKVFARINSTGWESEEPMDLLSETDSNLDAPSKTSVIWHFRYSNLEDEVFWSAFGRKWLTLNNGDRMAVPFLLKMQSCL